MTRYIGKTRDPDEWRAHWRLIDAATAAVQSGQRLRCCGDDRELWISDRPADRTRAAALCAGCPVLIRCRQAGQAEGAGVWGGVDRDHPTGGR